MSSILVLINPGGIPARSGDRLGVGLVQPHAATNPPTPEGEPIEVLNFSRAPIAGGLWAVATSLPATAFRDAYVITAVEVA